MISNEYLKKKVLFVGISVFWLGLGILTHSNPSAAQGISQVPPTQQLPDYFKEQASSNPGLLAQAEVLLGSLHEVRVLEVKSVGLREVLGDQRERISQMEGDLRRLKRTSNYQEVEAIQKELSEKLVGLKAEFDTSKRALDENEEVLKRSRKISRNHEGMLRAMARVNRVDHCDPRDFNHIANKVFDSLVDQAGRVGLGREGRDLQEVISILKSAFCPPSPSIPKSESAESPNHGFSSNGVADQSESAM
jgi:hypothetical protein